MPPKDPEARRKYMQEYYQRNRERMNARNTEYRRERYQTDEKYREYIKQQSREFAGNNSDIKAAQQRVYKAIQRGEIERPNECQNCGAIGAIETSHNSYEGRLDIEWLCRSCHRRKDQ